MSDRAYEVNVSLPAQSVLEVGSDALAALFQSSYETLFDRVFAGNQFELVNLRLVASGPQPTSPLAHPLAPHTQRGTQPRKGERQAFCAQADDFVSYQIYDRYKLVTDEVLHGPCIIEERESSTVIGTGGSVYADQYGLLRISLADQSWGACL
jgi:N-methylhydantoinase A/oxoprolinase/acetone carboxylase beta subunit